MSPPRLEATPEFVLPQMLRRRAEDDPSGVLLQTVDGGSWDHAAVHEGALRRASVLADLGVGAGDTVAVLLATSPDSLLWWLGAAWLRAWEVGLNTDLRGRMLAHALQDCGAGVIVTSATFLPRIAEVAAELTHLRVVVAVDRVDDPTLPWPVLDAGQAVDSAAPVDRCGPDESDPYSVIYTSGTTGPSKGVISPWGGFHSAGLTCFPDDRAWTYDDPAVYCYLPTFHSGGKMHFLLAVQGGMRFVQRSHFSAGALWEEIRRFGCTHVQLLSVAGLVWQLRRDEDRDNPLRRVLMLPMIPEYAAFEEHFGVRVNTAWGMTEIGLPLATDRPVDPHTCGSVVQGYQVRIVDGSDHEVPRGEVGELIVRHERPWRITTGYLGRPAATAEAWRNGWFHTGDALREGDGGQYYFVDRVKDYVRYRGHNVSSLEVEALVAEHPAVAEAACVGIPGGLHDAAERTGDALGDEDILVAVVPAGPDLDPADLFAELVGRMPRYMLPRYIRIVDALPRTPTHKVRKVELRSVGVDAATWDRVAAGVVPPR